METMAQIGGLVVSCAEHSNEPLYSTIQVHYGAVSNMQHYSSVNNILTEQTANECNPYVATAIIFIEQQQEAVMEVCMNVMHCKLKRP
jgi:hypothetical protein